MVEEGSGEGVKMTGVGSQAPSHGSSRGGLKLWVPKDAVRRKVSQEMGGEDFKQQKELFQSPFHRPYLLFKGQMRESN